jgi:phospholipase/lecithinase/hemolysin
MPANLRTPSHLLRFLAPLLILFSASGLGLAQPTITRQPASLAVLLSSHATFRVIASGTAPLAYQWQLDGRELIGATNASLVVSNVILADLGSYTVAVHDGTGEITSQPAWLKLARWTDLVVFDASISFTSNGKSWVEWFAERACLSAPDQVKNYATGGASCSDVRSQIATYLGSHTPGAHTLLAPWWAGMTADLVWNHRPVEQVISNYAANITQLAKASGKIFILPTLVPLYLNPGLDSPYARSLDYQDINARMDREIAKIQANYDLTVFRFDYSGLCTNIVANPMAYGFTNVTGAAESYCPPGDANKFLWWDWAHPTTKHHRQISDETYRCLTPPLGLLPPTRNESGTLAVQWQGGSGPFRLQQCDDLASGLWQSGKLTFELNENQTASPLQRFFRVLQLGQ